MSRIVIFILLYFPALSANANLKVSNLVEPVKYFVNHEEVLSNLENGLSIYGKMGLVGISGIGKTQVARMYAYKHQNEYNLIWFFDCNTDLKIQFLHLAREINNKLCKDGSCRISENIDEVRKSIITYLTPKKNWLLVFDNLKINENSKISDITTWDSNGNVIICSQDGSKIMQGISLPYIKRSDSIKLVKTLLINKNIKIIEDLVDSFKGYPLIVAQGSTFLNENKHVAIDDYRQILDKSFDQIKAHTKMVLKELSPGALDILFKMAVINNSKVSLSLLKTIVSKETFFADMQNILRFGLITINDEAENQQTFEMHDAIKKSLLDIAGDKQISQIIKEVINKIDLFLPKSRLERHLRVTRDNTLLPSLEQLFINAGDYKLSVFEALALRKDLMSMYLDLGDYEKCQEMVDWLEKYNDKFKLLSLISNHNKANYSEFLVLCAEYKYLFDLDYESARNLLLEAEAIAFKLDGFLELKVAIYSELAQYYASEGEMAKADDYIKKVEEIIKKYSNSHPNLDSSLILLVKAKQLLHKGNYVDALNEITRLIRSQGYHVQETYTAPAYILQASILNYMGRFKEASEISNKIYEQERKIIKKDHQIHALALVQMARAEYGLGLLKNSLQNARLAKKILIDDKMRDNKNLHTSQDIELADAFVVEGDVLLSLGDQINASNSYSEAANIYYNRYRLNLPMIDEASYLYLQGAKASCKLPSKIEYNKFKQLLLNNFGGNNSRSQDLFSFEAKMKCNK